MQADNVILSIFFNFSQFVLSSHPLLPHQFLSPYQTFIVLLNMCHFLTLWYLLTFYVTYAPYKFTCCTHHTDDSYSRLIVRTLSAPIHFPNSTGVFGHYVILIWGDRDIAVYQCAIGLPLQVLPVNVPGTVLEAGGCKRLTCVYCL